MRRTVLAVVLAFGFGGLAGAGAGYARWHRVPAAKFVRQQELILNRAKDMPAGGVVVIGDSITERQRFDTLCGLPVLNAGIGSARLEDVAPIVPAVLARTRPARVVVEIGPNNFLDGNRSDLGAFSHGLDAVLSQAPPRPIVVGMTAPADHPANVAMRDLAKKHGGAFVEGVPATMTEDGLHLAPAGLAEWKRRVNAAC